MQKSLLTLVALGVASALADVDQNVQNDEPVLLPLTNLVWRCGPNARIENGILSVDVPPEKAKHGGTAWADLDLAWTKPPPEYPVLQIDRAVVRARMASRLDDMFLAGLEREKAELHRLYPTWSRTAALAIGYRDGDDREKIYTRTCQLAKRQDTWFRHQATAIYVPVGATAEETADRVRAVWHSHGPWSVTFKSQAGGNLL